MMLRFLQEEEGQALVEYVMALVLSVSIAALMNRFMKRGIGALWQSLAQDIAAPCKGCTPPEGTVLTR